MIEPGRAVVEEPAAEENHVDWARLSKDLAEKLLPALGGGALVGLGAKLFGAPTSTAVALALADAAFRPLVQGWYADFRIAMAKRKAEDDVTPDGAGI